MRLNPQEKARRALLSAITEDDVMAEILDGLDAYRYRVLKAVAHLRGKARFHATGQSKGIPDLLVRKDSWPPNMWCAIEVKKSVDWKFSSPEQQELCESGGAAVCHCFEDAREAVNQVEVWSRKVST